MQAIYNTSEDLEFLEIANDSHGIADTLSPAMKLPRPTEPQYLFIGNGIRKKNL